MSDLLAIAIDVATAMVCGFLFGVMWERERWEKLREDEMFSRLDRYIERTIGPAPSAGQTLPAETSEKVK